MIPRWAAAPMAVVCIAIPTLAAHAQEGRAVSEVVVNGVVKTSPFVVTEAASLKPGVAFSNEAFEADKQAIQHIGLYSSVGGRVETTAEGKLRVVFDVVENPVIQNIVITGNKAIKTETLREMIRSRPGEVLNTRVVDEDVQRVQRYYVDNGYLAFVSEEIGIDAKTGVLRIPLVETVVESVTVEGNKKTRPYVILRTMRTKPGDAYNTRALQRDLSLVYGLGLFDDIGPLRREPGSDLGKVRLIVPVQERRTGQVSVGFGYSSRQRLVGRLELSETNFRGRGQGVNFLWEVGGIASRNSFEVGFSEPWIDRRNTSLALSLYDRALYRFTRTLSSNATGGQDDDPYYERHRGGSATLSRPFAATTRGYLTLRTEDITANNLNFDYSSLTNEQINNIRSSLVQDGAVTSLTLRSSTNTRDNDLDPATGIFLSPSLEFGSSRFNYERPRVNPDFIDETQTPNIPRILIDRRSQQGAFTKLNVDVRRYLSLSGPRKPGNITEPKRVLAGRLLGGVAGGSIGFSEQYFLGGAETLRGFPDDRFWGNRFLLASLELRIPLDSKGGVTGVLFSDIGDAWGATEANRENIPGFEQHSGFEANVGAGLGVRLRTPIGPVRLDYGFSREGGRTHFSIGQAF